MQAGRTARYGSVAGIEAQVGAALENDDIVVADAIVSAIDTDGAEGVSDADIAAYLSADADEARTRLRNV